MQSVKIRLELITPMFMAGADSKTPELRAPSIKGMMRFWWRAIKAESNLDELREEEAKIFGSSNEKIGKSPFSIRIDAMNQLTSNKFSPVPHSNKTFTFWGYKPNQIFSIILSSRNDIAIYHNILKVALLLGGVGKRSRRGFGSLNCTNWNFTDIKELSQFVLDRLNSLCDDFKMDNSKIKRESTHSADYPFIKEITFGKSEKDTNILLKKIGQASHNHKDNALGSAKPRMASPVYVSVAKVNNNYLPLITTLNSAFPPNNYNYNLQGQDDFKKELL